MRLHRRIVPLDDLCNFAIPEQNRIAEMADVVDATSVFAGQIFSFARSQVILTAAQHESLLSRFSRWN